jgi:uncharacterized membrane protein (DUF106 family)
MALDISVIPWSTLSIMLISVAISFANVGLNRFLISRMVGWHEYKSMQKELAEYNALRMKALRANDTKLLDKLKKKDTQMKTMQMKMSKPQLLLFPMMFIYFIIWPFLQGFYVVNNIPQDVIYLPGFGGQQFYIWYLMCSFFFGTLATKIIGITPIE